MMDVRCLFDMQSITLLESADLTGLLTCNMQQVYWMSYTSHITHNEIN